MRSTLRINFIACLALFLLSGCSFLDNSVLTCEEPQEYQESMSIASLIVPDALKSIQNKSAFNIPNIQGGNVLTQERIKIKAAPNQFIQSKKQDNQIVKIEGDELSELLSLIDQTISNRQLDQQYNPIYENVTSEYVSDSSVDPCFEVPPKYFAENITPRSMPSQNYAQQSDMVVKSEEKSRREKRRESRQKRTGKQPQDEPQEDMSSKKSENTTELEESKLSSIWKTISGIALGLYAGGTSEIGTLSGGQDVAPKPTDPDEKSILADKVRDLAMLDPSLNDEEREFIQNMSDSQVLELIEVDCF